MICPDCNGERKVFAHVNRGEKGPSGFETIDCFRCKAAGEVPDEQALWILEGKLRRTDRISRDISLREEAQRLGIPVVQLSAMERGMQPFPTTAEPE